MPSSIMLRPLKLFFDWWNPSYKRRVVEHLCQLLPDEGTVLDVGCDNGFVATTIMAKKPGLRFEGVDVQEFRSCSIPRKLYDGLHFPFPDDSFDVVMAVDVLHHTNTIMEILSEMGRVSRKHVLVKDHMSSGPISRRAIGFGDWLSNVPYGIKCVYNYPTAQGWEEHIRGAGLTTVRVMNRLSYGVFASSSQNPIMCLEKSRAPGRQIA